MHHYLWIYCIQSLQAQKPEAIIKAMMQKAEAFDGYCYCCITALPDMLDRQIGSHIMSNDNDDDDVNVNGVLIVYI